MKPERDREAAKSRLAEAKLRRQREAIQAVQDRETERLAVQTKTQRLRAERLAREALEPPPVKKTRVAAKSIAKSPVKQAKKPAAKVAKPN
ncbi:hypothetical protein [Hyphomicrobium facile]|uniref:Uncharacterized protein n=1 Tax=Hyphomicrobium facile TaxID=51670 RepID=A0A1I7MX59_9HYPH|nr:hypothetical protein [Hyphomicrobium facile]SFV26991.1 hypothetical protein SAMN04488557_0651 [Hyphomicrobium facile]